MKARKFWPSSLVASVFSLAALSACTGAVSDNAGTAGNTSSAAAGAAGGSSVGLGGAASSTGGAPATPPPDLMGTPVAESAGAMLMRRLTYREYDHMMNVLLGDTTFPASSSWSADAVVGDSGFIAPVDVAQYHVPKFMETADTLVDTALASVVAGKKAGKFVIPCTNPTAAQETACVTTFITTFGKAAYRRPVSADEQMDLLTLFTTVHTTDKLSFTDSVGAVAKAMLQSPNFIYHWELGPTKPVMGSDGLLPLTQWQIASRLASALWESMPDDTLLAAAENNQLSTPAQVIAQGQRMLADPQAIQSLYSFHVQWLFTFGFHSTDLTGVNPKDPSLLTAAAADGLYSEFTQFISSVYTPPGDGTLTTLYTAPYAFVNKDLAAIYGVAGPATGFAKVNLDPTQRAGIFTQVSFLAGIELSMADNPVYRGLSVYTKALCGHIDPPPPNVPGVPFTTTGTTRQSYDAHGSSACAAKCHALFDPAGFAFENYDGVGQYRTTENGVAVDSSGTFAAPPNGAATSTTFKFNNAVEMVKQIAASPEAQTCVDRQWTRYILGHMETADDQGSLQAAYQKGLVAPGFSVRDMLSSLLSSKAFMYRKPSVGEPL
jgi:Protein of unknown function (DUF1592)/Protein of unknown function (DUF1588)/Protein of unknown function (DUF1595)/Protein of unknown function (DUF1585)